MSNKSILSNVKSFITSSAPICKLLLGIWFGLCGMITLAFLLGSSRTDTDGSMLILCYFFLSIAFFIPTITIGQGINATADQNKIVYSDKSWGVTLLLSFFFGFFGAHRFYTGKKATGIIYIFTMGGFIIGWSVDCILILLGRFTDKHGHVISMKKQNSINQSDNEIKRNASQKTPMFSDLIVPGKEEQKQSIPTKSAVPKGEIELIFNDDERDLEFGLSHRKFLEEMRKYVGIVGNEAPFVPFMKYWPTYDSMDKRQRAWYFYWRTEVRSGKYPGTDLSYIFVHVYELLNGYGWENPQDGFAQLISLWMSYRERFPELDHYLYAWSFDFAQLHNLDFIIPDCPDLKSPHESVILDLMIDKYKEKRPLKLPFTLIDTLCDYSLVGSRFYKDGNQILMNEAIPRVIALADAALFKKNGKGILELYGPNRTRKQSHYLFRSAVTPNANKRIELSVKAYTSSQKLRNYINDLVRYAENVLRSMYGYRGRLRGVNLDAEMATLIEGFLQKEYSPKGKEKSALNKKVEVKLDFANIEDLRIQSDAVRDALEVVDEPVEQQDPLTDLQEIEEVFRHLSINAKKFLASLQHAGWECLITNRDNSLIDEINKIASKFIARSLIAVENGRFIVEDDYRDELEYICANNMGILDMPPASEGNDFSDIKANTYFDVSHLSEAMKGLITELSNIQQESLWTILVLDDPHERLGQIAEEAMAMPEILIDEINDIATQYLDDILIDTSNDVLCVLDQYVNELKNAVKMEVNQ